MRKKSGGVLHLAEIIDEDLQTRSVNLSKPQRRGLADLAASVLTCRSVNTSELANVLPRDVRSDEERYRYINRWLANETIDPSKVMRGFIPEILEMLSAAGQTIILMMDQSKVGNGFECLMLSLRIEERAIPVLWRVIKTEGEIGFEIQKQLLEAFEKMMPAKAKVLLTADRFYGTAALIALCQSFNWQYRIRLKGNLILNHQGGEIKTGELARNKLDSVEGAEFNKTGIKSCIGVLHEEGHEEPWIIAMDCIPTRGRVLDYGMRWGIEPLFSDMKTRGFRITQTQLRHADRIERLMLILALACFWAVSTGMQPKPHKQQPSKKKKRGVVFHSSKEA